MTIEQLIEELQQVAKVTGETARVQIQTMLNDDAELVAVRMANGSAVLDIEVITDNPDAL